MSEDAAKYWHEKIRSAVAEERANTDSAWTQRWTEAGAECQNQLQVAVEAEREACARVLDRHEERERAKGNHRAAELMRQAGSEIRTGDPNTAAIRARGKK